MTDSAEALRATLERARDLGFLGPGPVADHLAHARGFLVAESALGRSPGQVVDLGSGGGVPGLVLAAAWPESSVVSRREQRPPSASTCGRRWSTRAGKDGSRSSTPGPRRWPTIPGCASRSMLVTRSELRRAAGYGRDRGRISDRGRRAGGQRAARARRRPLAPRAPAASWVLVAIRAVSLDAGHFVVLTKTQAAAAGVPRPTGRPAKRPLW